MRGILHAACFELVFLSISLMSKQDLEEASDAELFGETAEEINNTLRYRDEVITGSSEGAANSFAPPTLDGCTLLFSRYAWKNTPLGRVNDVLFVE